MDQYALQKLGNVTIEKIPPSTEVCKDANVSVSTKEPSVSSISSRGILLPKLPPSINITIKPNPSSAISESPLSDENADDETEELQYSDHYQVPSSISPPIETKDAEVTDAPSNLSSPGESSSEICDNLTESSDAVHNENVETIDCQELSESVDDEEFDVAGSAIDEDDKMESKESEESVEKEYEDESELPEVKEEFVGIDEYEDGEGTCGNDLPEVPVNELIEGELPESVICKDEEFSDKESDTTSDDADDEQDGQTDETDGTAPKKKKKRKTKSESDADESNGSKKQKTSEKTEGEEKETTTSELKVGNLRRNIREVMDETKLDEATLSAQMQEKERLRRVQEQLRANRDIQRQMMQARVLSLIETGSTSISYRTPEEYADMEEQKPNTVVVKLHSGSGPQRMLDLLKKQKTSDSEEDDASLDKFASLSRNLSKPQMMTSSVSIAPVKQEPKMTEIKHEAEDEELTAPVDEDDDDDDDQPKNKDIVMISSSSSSSSGEDDDCIVISEDEESEPEEDTGNSGMHTNDLYNVPDEQGRVLINVGHAENEEDVFLAPQIARIIKPHQIGGVRFLFDNIVESLSRFTTSEGFGCILAHSMGLGKTLQVVSFCDVFLRYTEGRSVLCIMPINTLQNWVAEFNMWLPIDPETSPLKEQGEVSSRHFPLFVLNDNQKSLTARAKVIQNWYREGGVLLIGYELYRQLCLKKSPKVRLRSKKKEVEEEIDDEKSKSLLETMYNALVKPGPDLVICDEGHRIKNSHASISHALKQIRSKRRVVLTGYPLQNNLLEYWCMVDFVRPNYLGTKTEFSNMFERPIQNGQCIDSTPQDVKLMRYRAHVLHSLLEGFVQRRSHRVLQQTLPQKYEFVMLLKLTSFQKKLYNTFMNEVVRTKAVPNPLKAFAVCCKIWNHPDILHYFLKKRAGEEDIDLDLDETVPIGTPASDSSTPMTPSATSNLLAGKRGRTPRKSKDKPPRKNARTSTPQPINKPPSMAPIPPNTANNPKPPNPEHAITSANNQPIPPFNSYNNQFPNFNQSSNENTSNFSQSSSTSQNFANSPFSQAEYSPNQASGSGEYNNFQQNYNESGNYYQSEYEQQSNYWPGANNEENHFYNTNSTNSAASNAENFYPSSNSSSSSSSQSTSQSYSTEFSGSQSESTQSDYASQNFNYTNQPMQQFSREFPAAKQDIGGIQSFSNSSSIDSGIVNDLNASSMYPNEGSRDMNFSNQHQSPNAHMDSHHFPAQNVHNDGMAYNQTANRDMYAGNVDLTAAEQNAFNSFTPPPTPKSRRGRPPSQSPRAVASRQKRANAKAAMLAMAGQNTSSQGGNIPPPLFKPGLMGGAPLKTGNPQSFAADQPNMPAAPHLFQSNDMNQNYQHGQMDLQAMGGEGIWNAPPNNQNAVFANQNYGMYNEMPQNNSNFIANEAPAMMNEGGARGSRNLLNDIQPSEIFNPPEGGYQAGNADGNMFHLDNFNYLPLNDIPMAGHTSFMGLLEGVDSMEMGQSGNVPAASAPAPASQAISSSGESAANYMEPGMQYQATNANANPVPVSSMTSTAMSNKDSPYSETVDLADSPSSCRDVSDSLMGLARKGQITLKKVQKKGENLVSPPEKPDPEFAQGRLPSMDMFGSGGAAMSQNFAGSAESSNFGQTGSQYGFAKNQSASTSSATSTLSTQTNWESYGGYQNEYNTQGMVDKAQNFGNFGAAANSSHEAQRNKLKAPFERAPNRMATQTENYESGSTRDTKEQLSSLPSNSGLMAPNVTPKKPPEDDMSRNFYQGTGGTEIEANNKNVFGSNAGVSDSITVNMKLMSQNRNPQIIPPSEVFKSDCKKSDTEDADCKMGPPETPASKSCKEEPGIPYDWALEFFKDYSPGKIEASAKTLVFFCMLDEIIRLGDRLLLFSQSLFTLDLLEDFLNLLNIPNTEEKWARNKSYFRLDGSTSALEREKLINEFNQNPNVHLFLVSTRAGSLGINLVGANRVVVFDASWNPCHDTQAVCRVYRYGQQKPCYVYRFVMDSCLEKKIYDRQINKQGLSDRIVDECNPDAHLTIKDVANLCWDDVDLTENKRDFHEFIDKYEDVVMKKVIKECGAVLSKEPFQHESLLVDRADKKLSQAEKRMAKRGYELEKQASLKPTYGLYTPLNMQNRMKPTASVRPMAVQQSNQRETVRRWIPAEVWQKQGMSAQEMTLPLDVVIPTGTADNRSEIKLDAGQKVIVLKSPKGIYMQLENGKIIAIKAALKPDGGPVAGKPPISMPGRPPNPAQMAPKMPLKPPVDRNLVALTNRRGVTVSPIRQRFPPMRPQPNIGMPNMPPRPQGLNRGPPRPPPQQMPRPFSQASRSPQGRSPSRGLTAPPGSQSQQKSIFGPNSAVSISVANQKNMESQMRGPMGVDQPMGRGASSRPVKDEYARNYDKEGPGHLTEVAYDDYSSGPLREPMSRTMNEARKAANPMNEYSSSTSTDSGYGSRPPYGHPASREGRNTSQYMANNPRPPSNRSDALAESLKYKKDINLTPVPPKTQPIKLEKPSMLDPPKPKLPPPSAYQQHPHQQQPYQMSQAKLGQPKPPHGVARGRPPPMNLAPDVKIKKDPAAPAKPVELPKSSAISIFPVVKKNEDGAFQPDQTSYPSSSQAKGDFYSGNYQNKQFSNYSSNESQPFQYDSYKQNYQPGFANQSEYSNSQQQSFNNSQYSSNAYQGEGFAGGSYASENSSQYSNANLYPNQSSSQGTYDQYGSYYNYGQKNESAQPPPRAPPSTSQ